MIVRIVWIIKFYQEIPFTKPNHGSIPNAFHFQQTSTPPSFFLQSMFLEIDPPVDSVFSTLARRVELKFSSSSITWVHPSLPLSSPCWQLLSQDKGQPLSLYDAMFHNHLHNPDHDVTWQESFPHPGLKELVHWVLVTWVIAYPLARPPGDLPDDINKYCYLLYWMRDHVMQMLCSGPGQVRIRVRSEKG